MSLKSIPLIFVGVTFFTLMSLTIVKSFNVAGDDEGFATQQPATEVQLEPILTTSTSKFVLSSFAADARVAQQLCQHSGGSLLSIESSEELESIKTALINQQENDEDVIWTSAIRYSNSTAVWSSSQEPFPFPLTESKSQRLARFASRNRRFSVRNRRDANNDEDGKCSCDCTTPLPPPISLPCKRPNCEGSRPACTEIQPRNCLISRPPICEAHEKNCTVECGTPKDCRVIRQPKCKIVENNKQLCRLEQPNLGNCRTIRGPNCRITKPGRCHSHEVNCTQEDVPCVPIVKPCKNPCSKQECTTVQPACVTTNLPCQEITVPCPPQPPSESCINKCMNNTDNKELRYACEQNCAPSIVDCSQRTTVCPPSSTVCPPAVSSCTRPFVDCSPEICQSNVLLCPPPKLHCPPPQVICESPEVACDDPEVECPEPEVICDEPEIKCTKPLIKCLDPVVHCDPIITTCESAPTICSDPILDCKEPTYHCGEPIICPLPILPPDNGNGCPCSSNCGGRGKRDVSSSELECIAFNSEKDESEWVAQNCDLKHRFICRIQT